MDWVHLLNKKMLSLLWHRKGIWPVKNWVVGCWHGYLSGASCRLAYVPADATATHCLLLQIGFTFLVPVTRVAPEKGPLNGCVCELDWVHKWKPVQVIGVGFTEARCLSAEPIVSEHCREQNVWTYFKNIFYFILNNQWLLCKSRASVK